MESNTTRQHQIHIPPQLANLLLQGDVTLGQVAGLEQKKLYEIANIGFQMLNSGKLEEAKIIYRGLVAAAPYDSVFHCHLGAAHHRANEIDEALYSYNQALAINHTNIDALAGRGEISYLRGNYQEAIQDLRRVFELDPTASRPSTQRARSFVWALKEALEGQETAANADATANQNQIPASAGG